MQKNQNIQESVLFDDSVSHINSSSNDSNIVHKNIATSFDNNIKNLIKAKTKFDIAYFIDELNPHRHLKLLIDSLSKSEVIQIKNDYFRNHTRACSA